MLKHERSNFFVLKPMINVIISKNDYKIEFIHLFCNSTCTYTSIAELQRKILFGRTHTGTFGMLFACAYAFVDIFKRDHRSC